MANRRSKPKSKERYSREFYKRELECTPFEGVDFGFTGFYSPVIKVKKKYSTSNMPDIFDIFEIEIV